MISTSSKSRSQSNKKSNSIFYTYRFFSLKILFIQLALFNLFLPQSSFANFIRRDLDADNDAEEVKTLFKFNEITRDHLIDGSGSEGEGISYCDHALNNLGIDYISNQNQEVKKIAQGLAAQSGIDAATNAATGGLYQKQVGDIQGSIDRLSELQKNLSGTPPPTLTELQTTECEQNPFLPQCQQNAQKGIKEFGFGEFNVRAGGAENTRIGAVDALDVTDNSGRGAAATVGNANPNSFGSSVGGLGSGANNSGDGSFEGMVAGPANVKSGGAPSGGGGGANLGGATAPNIGNAPKDDSQAAAPTNTAATSRMGYTAGGGGGLGGRAGYADAAGGNSRKGRDGGSENPFAEMFGKGKGGGSGEELNFRDPASSGVNKGIAGAETSVFTRISQRYKTVSQNGRLIEYEVVEENQRQ